MQAQEEGREDRILSLFLFVLYILLYENLIYFEQGLLIIDYWPVQTVQNLKYIDLKKLNNIVNC